MKHVYYPRVLGVVLSLMAASAGNAGPILFQDNFNDGNADGWQEIDGAFDVVNGEYQISSFSFANDARAVNGDSSWTDYIFESDFLFPSGHASMLFRIESIASGTDVGRYYQFHVFDSFAGICVMNSSSGNCQGVLDVSRPTSTNVWHHARLEIQGNTVDAFIDGNHVLTYNGLTQYQAGRIGVKKINGPGFNLYDNVVVSGFSSVPEPSAVLLFSSGFLLLALKRRRQTQGWT